MAESNERAHTPREMKGGKHPPKAPPAPSGSSVPPPNPATGARVPWYESPGSPWKWDWHAPEPSDRQTPQVDVRDPEVRHLYGPRGEVLKTYTDKPLIGYHQRSQSR